MVGKQKCNSSEMIKYIASNIKLRWYKKNVNIYFHWQQKYSTFQPELFMGGIIWVWVGKVWTLICNFGWMNISTKTTWHPLNWEMKLYIYINKRQNRHTFSLYCRNTRNKYNVSVVLWRSSLGEVVGMYVCRYFW